MSIHSRFIEDSCNIKELIHKAVRKQYDATGQSSKEVIGKMKGNRQYAVGFNGQQFVGIKLTPNKFTAQVEGLKIWTAVMDNTTCDSCRQMNEQSVPMSQQFIFNSGVKTYKLDQPPLHGFNSIGDKKIPNAIPGTEEDYISRFEFPSCRCMAIMTELKTPLQQHWLQENNDVIEFVEDEVVDRFLLEVVTPLDTLWTDFGPDKISDDAYEKVAVHFEDNYHRVLKLIEQMKKAGIIETLKNEKYI